jgi:hypothetical protein
VKRRKKVLIDFFDTVYSFEEQRENIINCSVPVEISATNL